jgi:uncharacterized membrane protein
MTRRFVTILSLLLPLLLATAARAQNSDTPKPKKIDTVITGTVLDANGKPVPAAAVNCQSSAGIKPRIVHTDSKGHFRITGLTKDWYDLRASSNGAYSEWEKNIPLRKGQTKDITLRLLNGNTALSGVLPAKKSK